MKNVMLRKYAGIFAAAVSAAFFTGCQSYAKLPVMFHTSQGARSISEIQASGKIRIAAYSEENEFSYIDKDGRASGYGVYFGNRIAKDLGVQAEYVPILPSERIETLDKGKVDVLLANFTKTSYRETRVDFALPYMKVSLGVLSPEKALITTLDELNGKTLIVVKGTKAETFFRTYRPEIRLLSFDGYKEAYDALITGTGDAFSSDNTIVRRWAYSTPGFKAGIETFGSPDVIAPAVRKGNTEMLKWLNREIRYLAGEKFFHTDFEETLRPIYGPSAKADDFVIEGGTVNRK